jgi:hypothetical protein
MRMLCEQCRDREAVVTLTTVSERSVTSTHLCEACASARGVTRASREETPRRVGEAARLLAALVAEVEARADPAEIAWLLVYIEQQERAHPAAPLPPEVAAFLARHRPPAT